MKISHWSSTIRGCFNVLRMIASSRIKFT
jgi:hypothetical protein